MIAGFFVGLTVLYQILSVDVHNALPLYATLKAMGLPGDHVTLCGIAIPHDKGLQGHSDADVGLHAITDAILGALGAGDIGQHFPPSDPRWRGADSAVFLKHAGEVLRARGGKILHLDVTLA